MFAINREGNSVVAPTIEASGDQAGHWRGPNPHAPTLIHFAIPVLYGCMGTCYVVADLHAPLLIASTYYIMAFLHVAICYYEHLGHGPE